MKTYCICLCLTYFTKFGTSFYLLSKIIKYIPAFSFLLVEMPYGYKSNKIRFLQNHLCVKLPSIQLRKISVKPSHLFTNITANVFYPHKNLSNNVVKYLYICPCQSTLLNLFLMVHSISCLWWSI